MSSNLKIQVIRGVLYDLHAAGEALNTVATSASEFSSARYSLDEAIKEIAFVLAGVDYQVIREDKIAEGSATLDELKQTGEDLDSALQDLINKNKMADSVLADMRAEATQKEPALPGEEPIKAVKKTPYRELSKEP